MKNKFYFIITSLIIFLALTACEEYDEFPDATKKPETITPIKQFFISGSKVKLKQVYVFGEDLMTNITSTDSLFTQTQTIANIPYFGTYNSGVNISVLANIEVGEVWNIKPQQTHTETYRIDNGNRTDDFIVTQTAKWEYTDIVRANRLDTMMFCTNFVQDDVTKHFWESAEYGMMTTLLYMPDVNDRTKNIQTNLMLNVSYFDGCFISFLSNAVYSMSNRYTAPLTSNQVQIEIANGNYTLVSLNNGQTVAYKIGENFHIPTGIGNNYKYYGTSNANGMFDGMKRISYFFVFEII